MEQTYEATTQDLEIIREWIKQTPYIPQNCDDRYLASFIIATKGSIQKTKIVLEKYCSLGMKYPEMYGGWDPDKKLMKEYLETAYFFDLPKRTPNGELVIFTVLSPGGKDITKHHVLELFRLQIMATLLAIKEDRFEQGKVMIVTDCRNMSLAHVKDITPSMMRTWIASLRESLPLRLKGVHGVNVPTVIEWIFNIIKLATKKKISERVHLHSKYDTLYEFIPAEILPKEYGGAESSCQEQAARWNKRMAANKEFFIQEEKRIRDLDGIRPQVESDLDTAATFRKLNVD